MQRPVTHEIFERLIGYRNETRTQDELTEFEQSGDNVFLIHDFTASYWFSKDGKVYVQSFDEEQPTQANESETIAVLVLAAQRTNICQLLELLPPPPQGSKPCPACNGERWSIIPGRQHPTVCFVCSGRGWSTPQIIKPLVESGILVKRAGTTDQYELVVIPIDSTT